MTVCVRQLDYRRLRVPREDRSVLVEPSLDQVGALVEENLHVGARNDYDCQGRSLAELSAQARRELLDQARRWTAAYRDVPSRPAEAAGPIFMAGHQPQLFHPGVWLKNFALGRLARRHGAVAVNLLIDSDTVKQTSLQVPGGSAAQPRVEVIRFDRAGPRIPYEERRIADRTLFAGFGRRVAEQIAPLIADPMIEAYWPLARKRTGHTGNLGACLAQARHRLEADWGLQTLEVPQSRVCGVPSFYWFAAHLLAQLPRLREVYNAVVRDYRRVHRIRSAAHPVPDLAAHGGWLEAPLWIWTRDDPRRRALFARRKHGRIMVSDRHNLEISLPIGPDRDAAGAVEQFAELARRGVKIRSRALLTTLWARLVLCDLFVHGIGGARYDQVTDGLIERFFGLRPPGFMVLAATLHLPIKRQQAATEDARAIRQQLRQLVYHPECYLSGTERDLSGGAESPRELIAAKARWIRTPQTPRNVRTRCRAIRRINESLQPWVEPQRQRLLQLQAQTARALRAEAVLTWREYGFCLYPEKTFREFLLQLLPRTAQTCFDTPSASDTR